MSRDELLRKLAALSPEKRALFERLADSRAKSAAEPARISPRPDRETRPLSFAQERLYFLQRLAGEDPFYNLPSALELRGRFDLTAMRRAFAGPVSRISPN